MKSLNAAARRQLRVRGRREGARHWRRGASGRGAPRPRARPGPPANGAPPRTLVTHKPPRVTGPIPYNTQTVLAGDTTAASAMMGWSS
ncbi:hypothetical protein EVAR_54461_1 [Eumeta japonica]|uniref:Uncharacterized protein n=1 Tax=Eumeta variegata TaxID=151549 RepID=A0A4C1XI62_EUMVA|nr:hypothetical protein EVAR_54461_1 [Eumeta japonica]